MAVYREAQLVEPDANKVCNHGLCLVRKGGFDEAGRVLGDVVNRRFPELALDEGNMAVSRAEELMEEMEVLRKGDAGPLESGVNLEEEVMDRLDGVMMEWAPFRSRRLPIFEEIAAFRDQMAC